jgi:hypothetical protein
MICFEVEINGEIACVAGVGETGVLTSILTWAKNNPASSTERSVNELNLTVGGLKIDETNAGKAHLDWVRRDLQVGDQIRIKVIECSECDAPIDITLSESVKDLLGMRDTTNG